MAKVRTVHRCGECGAAWARWSGRCGSCGAWNALVEELDGRGRQAPARHAPMSSAGAGAVPILEVDAADCVPRPTGLGELDRVLSGGLVPGSVALVGGEPGIGKSTLLVQALAGLARAGCRCLLVSAEESTQQVRLRTERLGALDGRLWLSGETTLPGIVAAVCEVSPDYLVVDSIQTVSDPDVGSAPGSVAQVRQCAHELVRVAKERAMATLMVGHVTKEGSLAGPRVLEHVVDTVLSFEGERHHALRLLRAQKHRFGASGELGLFEMTESGLVGVPDGSGLLLGDRHVGLAGSLVVPTIEGRRPLLVELQALVAPSALTLPRRSAHCLDQGRLALLLAVLERRVGLRFGGTEVYASAVGGVRVGEPAADLALALVLASARSGVALPAGLVACGEVGLGGEVRHVGQLARRLAEAARLGFTDAIVPPRPPPGPAGLRLRPVSSVQEAVEAMALVAPG